MGGDSWPPVTLGFFMDGDKVKVNMNWRRRMQPIIGHVDMTSSLGFGLSSSSSGWFDVVTVYSLDFSYGPFL